MDIRWPQQGGGAGKLQRNENSTPTDYVLQICGVRDQVDSAAEKLNKLVKQIREENYEQEVRFSLLFLQSINSYLIHVLFCS